MNQNLRHPEDAATGASDRPTAPETTFVRATHAGHGTFQKAVIAAAVFAGSLAAAEGALLFVSLRGATIPPGGVRLGTLAGFECAMLLPLPVLVALLPCAWLLSRPAVRELGPGLRLALGGGDRARGGLGLVVYAALVAWALGHVVRAGEHAILASVSGPERAPVAMMTLFVAVVVGAALATAGAIGPADALLARISKRAGWLSVTSGTGLRLALLAVCAPTMTTLLPLSVGWTLASGALGVIAFLSPSLAGFRARASTTGGVLVALVLAALVFGWGLCVVLRRDPGVQLAVVQRSPLTMNVLVALNRLGDRDADGYPGRPLGGDCDDHDARVHPGAGDVPGDGIDQNCSGADATPFVPVLQPASLHDAHVAAPLSLVVVHLDALRPDHLSSEGYPRPTSPVLDRFREGAVWFENAYTPGPQTRVALQSIFTGLDVPRVPLVPARAEEFALAPGARTVAQTLAASGYESAGFTLPWVTSHTSGLERGFDEWRAAWSGEDDRALFSSAEVTTDAALAFLRTRAAVSANADGTHPYHLFVHHQCTHLPYFRHQPWDFGTGTVDRYDSALAYCDGQLGRLLAELASRADRERTAVIVYSDHGELFGERGFTTHGYALLEPDVRAVLALRIPGVESKTIRTAVSLTDLAPTLLALAGRAPDLRGSVAWNLLPLARGGDDARGAAARAGETARPLFLYADTQPRTTPMHARGVVRGAYRYLRDAAVGSEELYRVDRDPGETVNLVRTEPAIRAELAALLDSWESQRPLE